MGASKPAANRIAGRVVLVTGGGGGVGRASALAFAKAGCDVAVLGRTAASLAETARLVRAFHVRATHVTADVASRPEVTAALAAVVRELGPVGVLVNAAGIAESSPTVPPDDELFDRTMAINVRGPWVVTTACLPEMRRARFGRIVHVASTAALEGSRYTAAYVASKHALLGLVKSTALEVAPLGIRINALCPHMVDTPMLDRLFGDDLALRDSLRAMNPMRRAASCEEVAESALFLGSGRSGYVTGTHLAVDGGHIAQ